MQRLTSIDLMRGLAIIFMVLCHFPIFLSPLDANRPWLYFFSNHFIGDFAAPFFLFLSGFSQILSSKKTLPEHSGRLPKPIRRGIVLFLIGLLFSTSMHGLDALFEWDILPLIGFAMIVLYFIRSMDPWGILLVAFALIAASPLLRMHSDWLSYWGGKLAEVPGFTGIQAGLLFDPVEKYKPIMSGVDTLKGFFVVGYFPVFPWLAFPLAGYALGKLILVKKIPLKTSSLLGLGLFFALSGLGAALFSSFSFPMEGTLRIIQGYLSPLSFYPLTPSMFALQMGLGLILFALLRFFFDRDLEEKPSGWLNYFRRLSRYSLTVYVLHHAVIFWPLMMIRYTRGIDLQEQALSTLAAFAAGVFFLAALGPLLYVWDQKKSKFSLEWCLTQLAGK